ncbi:MAG: SEL1-like repeat protein [Alphaproteobacteria bacterium]|nr:SEL1-like repeat protein [Alphaproteobacteria bacterium]
MKPLIIRVREITKSARNYYGRALEFPSLADPFKSQAYYALGKMDYRGEGLESPNHSKASDFLEKAIDSGDLPPNLHSAAILMLKNLVTILTNERAI